MAAQGYGAGPAPRKPRAGRAARAARGARHHRPACGGAGVATSAALFTFEPASADTVAAHTFRGSFTDPNTPDWHYLPFRVPRGVRAIEVTYSFSPTDMGVGFSYNVVDIGMFDPSGHDLGDAHGFRGWSGGSRRQFMISRTSATPGYLAGPITPGVWNVILGPFTIVPPGTPWKVTVALHFGRQGPTFVPHPAPRRVPGTGPGWYPVDVRLEVSGAPGCVAQIRGPVGPLAGAVADDAGDVVVTVQVPAGTTPFVRAEVRRPHDVVVSPLDDAPGLQMVALTNPVFLG